MIGICHNYFGLSFLRQRIKIRCYKMHRSYGTVILLSRAIGSDNFVKLDFSPVYITKHKKRARGSAHLCLCKTYITKMTYDFKPPIKSRTTKELLAIDFTNEIKPNALTLIKSYGITEDEIISEFGSLDSEKIALTAEAIMSTYKAATTALDTKPFFPFGLIGFATAPPNNPECKSLFGPTTSTSQYDKPRKPVVMDGMSGAIIPVSEIKMTSFFSLAVLFLTNSARFSLPTSSSPSIINLTLHGN